jgi:hypothetical protein
MLRRRFLVALSSSVEACDGGLAVSPPLNLDSRADIRNKPYNDTFSLSNHLEHFSFLFLVGADDREIPEDSNELPRRLTT